jgi:glycosyltransferase involved in cell wall biosynthesis
LPVVGSDVGGVRESVVHAVTGFVVADPDAAADALEALVRDAHLRRRLGDAGSDRVRRTFSAPAIASELSKVLEVRTDGAR